MSASNQDHELELQEEGPKTTTDDNDNNEQDDMVINDEKDDVVKTPADEGDDNVKQSFTDSLKHFMSAGGKPKAWIHDRCNGRERVMYPNKKPCCFLMYPNGFLKLLPGLLESNCFMEWFGKVGIIPQDWHKTRRAIFGTAMVFSTIGWICILLADMAISQDYNLLQKFDFSHADVKYKFFYGDDPDSANSEGYTGGNFTVRVGLMAVAWTRSRFNVTADEVEKAYESGALLDNSTWREINYWLNDQSDRVEEVTGFGEFCSGNSRVWFVEPGQCDACDKASTKMVRSIVMATVFYFFTFKNDWLRFWPNYDVNCQKFMSCFVACITCGLALLSFFTYRNECLASFREGENCFFSNGTQVACPPIVTIDDDDWYFNLTDAERAEQDKLQNTVSYSDIDWNPGNGFILLGTAVFIRVFSMCCNLAVPTPEITRNHDMQWEYERIAREEDKGVQRSEYFAPW